MKNFLILLLLFTASFAIKAADVIKSSDANHAYFIDNDGNVLPLAIAYTTDGAGTVSLLGSSASITDDILVPKGLGRMYLNAADGKTYPAMVLYTTDGAGNIIPVPAGGGGGGGTWGSITGTLSSQTDLQNALNLKATVVNLNAHTSNTSNPHSVTKAQVGLPLAENTSDANKPVSTATQTALNLKANLAAISAVGLSGAYADLTGAPTIPLIQDSISDSNMNGATQNAIFDALGLKYTIGDRLYFPETGQPNCIICFNETGNDTGIGSDTDGEIYIESNNHVSARFGADDSLTVLGNIYAANYPPAPISGTNNALAAYDNAGALTSTSNYGVDINGFIDLFKVMVPNDQGGQSLSDDTINIEPLQNSPDENYVLHQEQISFDTANSGFTFGTSGNAAYFHNMGYQHQGTGDIGVMSYLTMNNNIGNGTDPVNVQGFNYVNAAANIQSGATILGQVMGHGFVFNMQTGSFINQAINPFYDQSQVQADVGGYSVFNGGPTILGIKNNSNFEGLNIHPQITNFTGNASANVIAIGGSYGTFDTGVFNGIMLSPNVTSVTNAYGIYVNMNDVTASGTKKAAVFNGDVDVNGALSFSGALSIGKLTSYGVLSPVIDGGGNPTSVNQLISQVDIPANATTANADTIGLNTAMLVNVGANSNITLGAFGLFSALALPAVIETHTGSVLPRLQGATFALSLSGTSDGGTITQAEGGRFVMIPNGITTITRSIGVLIDQPFGLVSAENFGIYQSDAEKNYFEGDVKVGGLDGLSKPHIGVESEKTIASKNGFQMHLHGSQPTCDEDHRGLMWNLEGGAGVPDLFQVCQKDITDAYVWVTH